MRQANDLISIISHDILLLLNNMGRKKKKIQIEWSPGEIWSSEQKTLFRKSDDWIKFRNKIIKERKKCEFCGYERRLSLHHIFLTDRAEDYTNLDPERFKVMCGGCHQYGHRIFKSMLRKRDPIQPDERLKNLMNEFFKC